MKPAIKTLSLLIVLHIMLTGCSKPPPPVSGLHCSVDEGWLISDDVYFTNKSGKDLTEVHVTMTLIGEKGDQQPINRYWANWHSGEIQHISISGSISVVGIQKVQLSGRCDQGIISDSWVKK